METVFSKEVMKEKLAKLEMVKKEEFEMGSSITAWYTKDWYEDWRLNEGYFVGGKAVGPWRKYFDKKGEGLLAESGYFVDGKEDGIFTSYDEDGDFDSIRIYERGELIFSYYF